MYDSSEKVKVVRALVAVDDKSSDAHTKQRHPKCCLDDLVYQIGQWLEATSDEEEDLADNQGQVYASEDKD